MQVEAGARYTLFGQRLIAVAWQDNDGNEEIALYDAATDAPCYRVSPNGDLEHIGVLPDGTYQGSRSDATVDDLVLAVRPLSY